MVPRCQQLPAVKLVIGEELVRGERFAVCRRPWDGVEDALDDIDRAIMFLHFE